MIIKSGNVQFHKDQDPSMLNGSGPRTYEHSVVFPAPYQRAPKVVVAIQHMDVLNSANARISLDVSAVTTTGFTLTLHTWADTRIWSLGASWITYGNR